MRVRLDAETFLPSLWALLISRRFLQPFVRLIALASDLSSRVVGRALRLRVGTGQAAIT